MLFRKTAGSFIVTIFGEPVPVRVGTADLSVMVQKASDQSSVLDAHVLLHLKRMESGNVVEVAAPATHDHATNKLLYAASLNLPRSGVWQMTVDVREQGEPVSAAGILNVLPAEAPLTAHWVLFALVPVMIVLFLVNQWLKGGRRRVRQSIRS